jgi:hypothetical protein
MPVPVSRLLPEDDRFDRRREGDDERLLPEVSELEPVSSPLPLDVPRPELPEPDVVVRPPPDPPLPLPVPVPRLPVPEVPTSAPPVVELPVP